MKQIISYLVLIVLTIESVSCLPKVFRQKRMPDNGADDLLLSPHLSHEFTAGNSDAQMIICKNRFDCEDYCRRTVGGSLSPKSENGFGSLSPHFVSGSLPLLTDSHKLGIQLGRRNDCDKCQIIYANCDQKFLNFAAKFWSDTKPISPKAKNDI